VALAVPFPGRRIAVTKNVPYVTDGAKAQRLDVYAPAGGAAPGAPVMIYVHGGAWVLGDKREQGKPMLFELVNDGWVCFSINYRLSPRATWPAHITDVLAAIAWVKAHAHEYGGDASFVALSGGSAGGHLAALAALAFDDGAFKVGFEEADCRVDACVPLYGVLDMTADRATSGRYGPGLQILLERRVFKVRIEEQPSLFEAASPTHRLREDAPPFLVIHGTNDTLVPVAVPRAFVPALRAVSTSPVASIELPLAQHAFDVTTSPRCSAVVAGIRTFLDAVRAREEPRPENPEDRPPAGSDSDVQSGSDVRETGRR
jgi:acetyl esterase/lipase